MTKKSIREIAMAWREDKRPYVKQSTFAAYMLILENHLLPYFGESDALSEKAVQDFVLQKLKGHSYCAQNGDEVRSKTRMDELFRMGHKISYNRKEQGAGGVDCSPSQENIGLHSSKFHIP